jgi:hydrogenase maturation protein HypF
MLSQRVNAPITTSAGRLFDGIAALIGLHQQVSFEGQAAMSLEYAADAAVRDAYLFALLQREGETRGVGEGEKFSPALSLSPAPPLILDWTSLLESTLADLSCGVERGMMAARFHNALVAAIVAVAQKIGEPNVALSGGCFQNRLLTERAATRLAQAGFRVLLHRHVPPNDGCISLGQVAVAATRISEQ